MSSKPPNKSAESVLKPPAPKPPLPSKPLNAPKSDPKEITPKPLAASPAAPSSTPKDEPFRVDSEQRTAIRPPKAPAEPKIDDASSLTPGAELSGYVVESLIAKGAMGEIWRAKNAKIGKLAAIKVPSPELVARKDAAERFLQEARAVNEIRHRNIVDIFAFGELADNRPYFVMEFLDGKPLSDHIQAVGPLPFPEIVEIFTPVCQALQAAHDAGIIHRDLKSENIFLVFDKKGRPFVKVLDFGIAKLKGAFSGNKNLTMDGAVYGTPSYMAPEQCQGAKNVDHRADIYSLGVVLYEMLTGRLPFREPDGNTGMLLVKHIAMTPFAPSRLVSGRKISSEIDRFVLRAISKSPEKRPQTCDAFAEEFSKLARAYAEETRESIKGAAALLDLEPADMGGDPNEAPAQGVTPDAKEGAALVLQEALPATKQEVAPDTKQTTPQEEPAQQELLIEIEPAKQEPKAPEIDPGKPEVEMSRGIDSKSDMPTPEVAVVLEEKPRPATKPWAAYAGAAVGVLGLVWLLWPSPAPVEKPTPKPTPASDPIVASAPVSEPASVASSLPAVPANSPAQLFRLDSDPDGAEVSLNGALLGVTPINKEIAPLAPGDVLRVVKAGYEPIKLKYNTNKPLPSMLFLVKKSSSLPPNPFKKKP